MGLRAPIWGMQPVRAGAQAVTTGYPETRAVRLRHLHKPQTHEGWYINIPAAVGSGRWRKYRGISKYGIEKGNACKRKRCY